MYKAAESSGACRITNHRIMHAQLKTAFLKEFKALADLLPALFITGGLPRFQACGGGASDAG